MFRSAPPINQTSSSPLVFFSSLKQSRFFTWLTQGKKEPQHYVNSWHRHFEHTDKDSKKKKGKDMSESWLFKASSPPSLPPFSLLPSQQQIGSIRRKIKRPLSEKPLEKSSSPRHDNSLSTHNAQQSRRNTNLKSKNDARGCN